MKVGRLRACGTNPPYSNSKTTIQKGITQRPITDFVLSELIFDIQTRKKKALIKSLIKAIFKVSIFIIFLISNIKSLAMTYFHMGNPTLSSAQSSFTSEFEMGSGGSYSLWSPGKACCYFLRLFLLIIQLFSRFITS